MVDNFPLLQQRPGSNSCLPTAVTAILWHYEEQVTQDQVSEWCDEGPDGCVIDFAMQGLRDQEYEVTQLTEDPEDEIRQYVNDADNPMPILVTIMPALEDAIDSEIIESWMGMDHAVVVLGFEISGDDGEKVSLMDPLCGEIRKLGAAKFFRQWDTAGQLAYLITT